MASIRIAYYRTGSCFVQRKWILQFDYLNYYGNGKKCLYPLVRVLNPFDHCLGVNIGVVRICTTVLCNQHCQYSSSKQLNYKNKKCYT